MKKSKWIIRSGSGHHYLVWGAHPELVWNRNAEWWEFDWGKLVYLARLQNISALGLDLQPNECIEVKFEAA